MPGVPTHFWLWTAVGMSLFGVIYWRIAQGQLEEARSRVMAEHRAMAATLGPKLFPLRDRVEAWVQELAGEWPGNSISPNADLERLRSASSLYLRLRLANAGSSRSIRKAAASSLRDGFTACLFVGKGPAPDPTLGTACRTIGDCSPGQLCNEWNVCAESRPPFNMRLIYRTLRVLSSEWTDEVHLVTSELGLSAYGRDLENVARTDVPVTVDLLARSKFFTLVLDEDPSEGLPEALPDVEESSEERVQRATHWARVAIWDLTRDEQVLRVRTQAAGELVMLGRTRATDPGTLAAQQRQINSCQLAMGVRQALGDPESGAAGVSSPASPSAHP